MSVNALFQFRHDLAANWTANNPVLLAGELGLESDTNQYKFGDGSTGWTGLPYAGVGPTGPTGASSGNFGAVTLNFGTGRGSNSTQTVVTGQSGILSTSNIQCWVQGDTTVNHNADEHLMAGLNAFAGSIVPGVGFTVEAIAAFNVTGLFTIRWVWN